MRFLLLLIYDGIYTQAFGMVFTPGYGCVDKGHMVFGAALLSLPSA